MRRFIPLAILAPLVAAVLLVGGSGGEVKAEVSPSQKFTANMAQVKATLEDFSQTVTRYNEAIREITRFDVAAAKMQVEEIRKLIEHLLGQIGSDSDLARSQYELVQWIERNQRIVRADPLLSSERKDYLLQEWTRRAEAITAASKEVLQIRKELSEQLNTVVGDETYLTQLIMLEKADEAAALIREFLSEIKEFADVLRQRLRLVPVPTS